MPELDDDGAICAGSAQISRSQSFEFNDDPAFWKDHDVQVIIRTRPLSSSEISVQSNKKCVRQGNGQTITWVGNPESRFTFDLVADENVTQEQMFKVAGVPLVENVVAGYNSCMFAYGQTGSGKTHIMLGDIEGETRIHSVNCGMTPRVFHYLFSRIQKEKEVRKEEKLHFTCRCSFLEIYNDQILDLLDPSSSNLQLREDRKKGIHVENLKEIEVSSARDLIQQLMQGAANRKVAATNMNRARSRSHSVFTCIIESKWVSQGVTHHRFARLNLVDLAGSERQKSSGAKGERLKEAININKSLSTLGLVIMNLVSVSNGKSVHVPYRDSKLTFLLQDSLGGNSKTIIIANISPSSSCSLETLSTLKFAQCAKPIKDNAIVNEDACGDVIGLQIQQLKDEIQGLKMMLNLRDSAIKSLQGVASGNVSVEAHLQKEKGDPMKEIEVLHAQVDRNQEVTKFATENFRLKEEVRRLKSQCDILNQQIQALQAKNQESKKLSSLQDENQVLLRMQAIHNRAEVESLQKSLSFSLDEKERLQKLVDNFSKELEGRMRSSGMVGDDDQMEVKTMVQAIACASQREAEALKIAIKLLKENDDLRQKIKVLIEENNKFIELYEQVAAENSSRPLGNTETDYSSKNAEAQNSAEIALEVEKNAAEELKKIIGNLENQLSEMHDENAMKEKDELKRLLSSSGQEKPTEVDGVDATCSTDTEMELCNMSSETSTDDLKHIKSLKKSQKVQLQQKIKQESEQFRARKASREKEIMQLEDMDTSDSEESNHDWKPELESERESELESVMKLKRKRSFKVERPRSSVVKRREVYYCTCTRKSSCKTMKCQCRAIKGSCGPSCGCTTVKCSNDR